MKKKQRLELKKAPTIHGPYEPLLGCHESVKGKFWVTATVEIRKGEVQTYYLHKNSCWYPGTGTYTENGGYHDTHEKARQALHLAEDTYTVVQ